jgi:hypothetical protein
MALVKFSMTTVFVVFAALLFLGMIRAAGPLMDAAVIAGHGVSELSTNEHALARHGESAMDVAAMFDEVGRCNLGPSVRLASPATGRRMFVCFIDEEVNIHLQNYETDNTITDIPSHDLSRPWAYLKNTILKFGYRIENIYGNVPEMFWKIYPQ